MLRDDENNRWWPVLYVGKTAKKDEQGSYVWKLRDELAEALKESTCQQLLFMQKVLLTFNIGF